MSLCHLLCKWLVPGSNATGNDDIVPRVAELEHRMDSLTAR
jgi:hypothetical protein